MERVTSVFSSATRRLQPVNDGQSDRLSGWVQNLRDQSIDYVRFELPDLHGISRAKVIPIDYVEYYAREGLNFYGGTLALDTGSRVVAGTGYHAERKYQDHLLIPDLETVMLLPWVNKTAKVICDSEWRDGKPVAIAPRYVFKQLLNQAACLGFDVVIGHEFEFYLLDAETKQPLFDGVHIFNHIRNQYIPEIDQLIGYLRMAGLEIITHNCEYAPSQFEINYAPALGLASGDRAFTFRNAVKEIMHRLGYLATFMSKPFPELAGCSCHVHLSLVDRKTDRNAFSDPADPDGLSTIGQSFIQGILDHAPAMLALVNPTPNCYRRLKPHTFAPSNISWGIEDRSALVRVKTSSAENIHLEMRAASGLSNPYLSAAATLAAGLLGIQQRRSLQTSSPGVAEEDTTIPKLPTNLESALVALNHDHVFQQMMGTEFCHLFQAVKQAELAEFHQQVTPWERQEYIEVY